MNKIALIIQREYFTRVRKKTFLVTTFLVPILFMALYGVVLFIIINREDPLITVKVLDESGMIIDNLENSKNLVFERADANINEEKKQIQSGSGETVLLLIPREIATTQIVELYDSGKKGIGMISKIETAVNKVLKHNAWREAGLDPEQIERNKPDITIITKELTVEGEKDSSIGAAMGISFTLSILIYISLFLYGSQVMRGIIEEKSSRIIEVIISSVKPFQLMMGKIIGIGLVGLTQFILWIVLSVGLFTVSSVVFPKNVPVEQSSVQTAMGEDPYSNNDNQDRTKIENIIQQVRSIDFPYILGGFLFYFIGGYLLYSALFASVGSAVDNETETQQFTFPIIMPLLFTYMLSFSVLINDPHGQTAFWLSMIPFTSPIAMLVRMPFGVPWWQIGLSGLFLILGFILTTYLASRIYRVGILMYGKKASYKEIMKWMRYKV